MKTLIHLPAPDYPRGLTSTMKEHPTRKEMDEPEYHSHPSVRFLICECGAHEAHLTIEEYRKVMTGEYKIVFACSSDSQPATGKLLKK